MYINASHILVETEEEAVSLKEKIDSGQDFSLLAVNHSKCPSGAQSAGNLGFFGPGQMVKEFDDVAREMEVGSVSEPVKTQFGFHLIKRLY